MAHVRPLLKSRLKNIFHTQSPKKATFSSNLKRISCHPSSQSQERKHIHHVITSYVLQAHIHWEDRWGFSEVTGRCSSPGLQMVSSSSKVKHPDFIEMKWAEKRAYKWRNKGSCLGSQEVCHSPGSQSHLMNTQGTAPRAGAISMPLWWPERSTQSHPSFYWHTEELSCICPKVPLPKTTTTIPSSIPFTLPALILVNPSLLILFLLPSVYFHIPPVPHTMGKPIAFLFFSVSKCTSTSPLALQLPLQILPLETQSPHFISSPPQPGHHFEKGFVFLLQEISVKVYPT